VSRSVCRATRRRIVLVWMILALVSPVPFPGSTARAQESGDDRPEQAEIRLLQQGPVLKQDGTYFIDVEVLLPPDADSTLEVVATVYQRVKTRPEFVQTNLNTSLGSVIGIGTSVDVNANAGAPTGNVREVPLRVSLAIGVPSPSCPGCINLRADGVYPIMVELRSTTAETVVDRFTTYVIRAVASGVEPLKVALIVPLRTEAARNSAGEEQVPSTRNLIGIIEALVARPSTPVSVAPTPETLDTLARLAQENTTSSPLLEQIREMLVGRELLDAPYASLPAAVANDNRLTRLLQGNRSFGSSTVKLLLAGRATTGIGIYADQLLGARSLATLRQQRVVVQESALQPANAQRDRTQPVLIDAAAIDNSEGVPVTGVILDSDLENHFVRKLSSRRAGADDVLRAQHLIADLAMLQGTGPGTSRGVAVLVPESTSQATLSEVLTGLDAKEIITPVTLSTLFDLPLAESGGTALVRSPVVSGETLPVSAVTQVRRILDRLDGYRSAFQSSAPDADELEKRLLIAVSSVPRILAPAPAPAFGTSLQLIEDETNARIGTIRLSPNDVVTLTARQQDVPIPIINDSGRQTTVVLEVSSDNVSLEGSVADPDRPGQLLIRRTIVIESRIHQEQVQVTTRGPGSFSMVLRLTTPSGLALTNVRYTLRSTAVGGLGKILTIGALLVLGAWWIRSILATRRDRSLRNHPSQPTRDGTGP